ncbi:hypothetical protein [Sphingomonas qomolangmaensis]|uniref:Integron n=1 Tax=Sphingomonas qomolangmaensis TaxID=2918765 RepID=A0ABY5L6X8_9SPHN|nr:hypothetical protein [Sphingomonas qomolangmaensis]UUL81363.1 hypothetical protein NMP03_09015 [Sphingomonas qomolangmaensis]
MRLFPLVIALPLAACNFATVETNTVTPEATATASALQPGLRPVRIGEGGPGFPACQSRATVTNVEPGATTLTLRESPFAEADSVVGLGPGIGMYVCTRTLDQRWLGVVVPPLSQPDADCGVRGRIERARGYDGPCTSGWVIANGVRLSGS